VTDDVLEPPPAADDPVAPPAESGPAEPVPAPTGGAVSPGTRGSSGED
jgi:hypothetical protein